MINYKQQRNIRRNLEEIKGIAKVRNVHCKIDKENILDYVAPSKKQKEKSKSGNKNNGTQIPQITNNTTNKMPVKKKVSNNKDVQNSEAKKIIKTEQPQFLQHTNKKQQHPLTKKELFNTTINHPKEEKIQNKDSNYFITADVSSVLRALNKTKLDNNSLIRKPDKQKKVNMMTQQDIEKLFEKDASGSKKKYSQIHKKENKENECRFNKKDKKYSEISEEKGAEKNLTGKLQSSKEYKRVLITEPEFLKRETVRFNIKQIIQNQPNQVIKPQKDYAQSIKFLQILEDSDDFLLSALANDGLIKVETDPKVDKTIKFKQDFVVGKQIGQGAYATVRVAIYKPQNKKVAIKIYEKKKIKQIQRRKSVKRQIKILQKINHPNIMKIYDVIETNNHVNIIMEYISGISLNQYLKCQPNLRAAQKDAKKIFVPLVEALEYIHKNSICHRDIKLENVLLDARLNPKLIDFGFSTCIQNQKKVKIFCGTPSYMAPQIVLKKEYKGALADIWALGVLLYVMLVGIFPFKGNSDKQLYNRISNSDYPKPQGISKSAEHLIQKMLKIDPEKRITAQEILNEQWVINNPRSGGLALSKQKKQLIITQQRTNSKNNDKRLINKTRHNRLTQLTFENSKQKKKTLAETYKGNELKYQINQINQLNDFDWSPKFEKPKTCTNRQSNRIKFDNQNLQQKPSSNLLELLKKEIHKKDGEDFNKCNQRLENIIEQKLTNKRYF